MAHATKKKATRRAQTAQAVAQVEATRIHRAPVDLPVQLIAHPYDEQLRAVSHHASVESARVYAINHFGQDVSNPTRYHIRWRDLRFTGRAMQWQHVSETTDRIKLTAHVSGLGGVRENWSTAHTIIRGKLTRKPVKHMAYAAAIVNEQTGETETIKGLQIASTRTRDGLEQSIASMERAKMGEMDARKSRVFLMTEAERALYDARLAHKRALVEFIELEAERALYQATGLDGCIGLFERSTFAPVI